MKKILNIIKKIIKPTRVKVITFLSLTFLCLSINELNSKPYGYPNRQGSPGESNCNSCHGGSGPNASVIINAGLVNLAPGDKYELSKTYEGYLTISYTGRYHWGFSIEILNAQGDNAGILIVTDDFYGQFGIGAVSPYRRRELIHTENIGDVNVDPVGVPNTFTYNFRWVSPATPMGPISFYALGMATNSADNSSGDYWNSTTITYNDPGL